MAFNPFLSMGEPTSDVAADTATLNPFMMVDDLGDDAFAGDNPFTASNPFAELGGSEPAPGDTLPADMFGGPLPPRSAAAPPPPPPPKPTALELSAPPPPRPLAPETHDLILSVTGYMELTSEHLLDRIPLTRTPSPVSARDMQSPEPELEPEPEPEPVPELEPPSRAAAPPPRRPPVPPPARPPPVRPAPPPSQQQDDINLFDAPVPSLAKPTKEAIMSLYTAPQREEKPIDFLSDDLPEQPAVPAAMDWSQSAPITTTSPGPPPPRKQSDERNPFEVPPVAEESTPVFADSNIFGMKGPFADIATDDGSFKAMQTQPPPPTVPTPPPGDAPDPAHDTLEVEATDQFKTTHLELDSSADVAGWGDVPTGNDTGWDGGASKDPAWGATTSTAATDADWSAAPATSVATADNADPDWGAAPDEPMHDDLPASQDAFDAFSAKFDSASTNHMNSGAWGDSSGGGDSGGGFEAEAFDPFLSMSAPPPPAATPRTRPGSRDEDEDSFNVFIKPAGSCLGGASGVVPALAPPEPPRANPFDRSAAPFAAEPPPRPQALTGYHAESPGSRSGSRSGGQSPPTPLFDDDVSVPLEDFPRTKYCGPGWEMQLRQPNKKKITGQRFWKAVFVRLSQQGDTAVVQLSTAADKEPFQELPLQACYSVSEVAAQQFDNFGKIFTVKLQYVFYKERPGVRPGQVRKAERITNKLSQFAAYAIQGDYQGVKEFGSDLRKLGLPVEHAPQVSQLFKLGSLSYEAVKQFSSCIEEALFRLPAHRDRALLYKMEEVQITAVDELYVEQDAEGSVLKQIARVRLFFLGFLSGMPDVELGVNDLRRQGREVVGRHDIIPVVTEEWIRVEDVEFHACVTPQDFQDTKIIKFKPPDACYIELMRFRVRPPKNRELPLQLKAVWCVTGNKVELRADVLVPGFASRKLGQVPCEDVAIRFPIPECWIYLFRVEKHFRYGSVKSAHRRTGKIKGIERFLGAVDTLQESLIEVTSGQAKYEHQHRAIVWRMPRLPKEGQGAYTTHNLVSRMALTSYDQIPAELAKHAFVEFTMPATQVSHMTVRSVSLQNHDADPPEKYVRYLARHEYIVGIERTSGQSAPAYAVAVARPAPAPAAAPAAAPAPAPHPQPPSSDSDSD